jgi:hypothetical protein
MTSIVIEIESIFNQVFLKTLYIADQIDPSAGELMIDKIPITEDDRGYFKSSLRDAATKLAVYISPLARNIETPYVVDEENGQIYYNINTSAHDNATLIRGVMPALIMRALVLWIIKEWLRIKGLSNNYYITEEQQWEFAVSEIKALTRKSTARIKYQMY